MTQFKNPFVELNEASKKKELSQSEVISGYEECLKFSGVTKASDILNAKFTSSKDLFRPTVELQERFNRNVALANPGGTGSIPLDGTSLITGVIEQVTPYVGSPALKMAFPEAQYASQRLLLDVFDPIVGMSHNTALDEPVPVIKKRGITTEEFQPASVQEALEISQEEILFFRTPGNQNISVRGLATYMAMWNKQLTHRGVVKQQYDLWNVINKGQFTWKNQAVSYGLNPANINVAPASGTWGVITRSSTGHDNIAPSATCKPILDLSVFINLTLSKYRGLPIKAVMNYATHQLFVQNTDVISRASFIYANEGVFNGNNTGGVTMDTGLRYYLGGDLNIEVIIDNSNYIADANDPDIAAGSGKVVGGVYPLCPDGIIWFYIDVDAFGGPLGEYAYTLAVQNGGTSSPKAGKYFYLVDSTLSQTFDGISQPRIFIGHGWNGSPRVNRPNDIFSMKVGSVTYVA